jgi:hypothetical protein
LQQTPTGCRPHSSIDVPTPVIGDGCRMVGVIGTFFCSDISLQKKKKKEKTRSSYRPITAPHYNIAAKFHPCP